MKRKIDRQAIIVLGLQSLAWAGREEALRHDSECCLDQNQAAALMAEANKAKYFKMRFINAAISAVAKKQNSL